MDILELTKIKEELKKAYPKSDRWHEKVNGMSERQAVAVYNRLKAEGKLSK